MSASILLHIYPREIWQNVGDAALLLTVSDENYIATWDFETGERITYLEFDYSPSGRPLKEVSSAGFDDNSSQVRVVFSDSTVGLWDARSGVKKEMISEVENSSDSIRYYGPDFTTFATVSRSFGGEIPSEALQSLTGRVLSLIDSVAEEQGFGKPSYRRLATQVVGNTIIYPYVVTLVYDASIKLSPFVDGVIKKCGRNAEFRDWTTKDIGDGQTEATLFYSIIQRKSSRVTFVTVHNTIEDTDFALVGHGEGVTSVAFSPEGKRVLTTSLDETSRIWDVKTGAELLKIPGQGGETSRSIFSPDGSKIVLIESKGVRIVEVPPWTLEDLSEADGKDPEERFERYLRREDGIQFHQVGTQRPPVEITER